MDMPFSFTYFLNILYFPKSLKTYSVILFNKTIIQYKSSYFHIINKKTCVSPLNRTHVFCNIINHLLPRQLRTILQYKSELRFRVHLHLMHRSKPQLIVKISEQVVPLIKRPDKSAHFPAFGIAGFNRFVDLRKPSVCLFIPFGNDIVTTM